MDQLNITLYGVENSSNFTPTDSILTERNGVREFHDAYKQIHGYLATTICILGVLLNIINIYILTRKSMRSSATNVLLCSLAVADLLTELLYLPFALYFFIVRRDIPVTGHPDGWVYFASISLGGQNISHTAAMWITVAIATFRYIYVCQHTKAHKLCSLKRAYLTIALVGLESCLACMPSLICFTVTDMPHPSANTTIKWIGTATICENNDGLLQKITMLVFGGIIKCSACITLVCFTVRLLYSMREVRYEDHFIPFYYRCDWFPIPTLNKGRLPIELPSLWGTPVQTESLLITNDIEKRILCVICTDAIQETLTLSRSIFGSLRTAVLSQRQEESIAAEANE